MPACVLGLRGPLSDWWTTGSLRNLRGSSWCPVWYSLVQQLAEYKSRPRCPLAGLVRVKTPRLVVTCVPLQEDVWPTERLRACALAHALRSRCPLALRSIPPRRIVQATAEGRITCVDCDGKARSLCVLMPCVLRSELVQQSSPTSPKRCAFFHRNTSTNTIKSTTKKSRTRITTSSANTSRLPPETRYAMLSHNHNQSHTLTESTNTRRSRQATMPPRISSHPS